MCGADTSCTVTVKEHGALLFVPSEEETVTTVVPIGNTDPGGWDHVWFSDAAQPSVAGAA